MPANSAIRSISARIAPALSPRIVPKRATFSRPVSSGWKPAPTSSRGTMRPQTSIFPVSCIAIPEINCVSVDFPEPFAPTMPKNSPRLTSKLTSESAQKRSCSWARRTSVLRVCWRLSSSPRP